MLLLLSTTLFALPIVNGEEESEFPSVVALGADFGGNAFSACTGNLITPEIILTAAHCGGDLPMELVLSAGKAFFGPSVNNPTEVIGFTELHVHPDYRELGTENAWDWGEYDMGMLVLEQPATEAPTPLRLSDFAAEEEGAEMISVGFGITSANSNDSGVKRSANLVLSQVTPMFLLVNNNDNAESANICSGDSGGPTFGWNDELGKYEQWAVHSWGDQYCLTQSGSTRSDVDVEWILDLVEEIHGTRDICEANGWYSDDVCEQLESLCGQVDPDCIEEEPNEEESKKASCSSVESQSSLFLALFPLLVMLRRSEY